MNLKNPALLFIILLIPVFAGIYYGLRAEEPRELYGPPRQEQAPRLARTRPAQPAWTGGGGIVSRTRSVPRAFGDSPAEPSTEDKNCAYGFFIGLKPDKAVLARLNQTRRPYRVLRPGSAMTQDYSRDRINLETDDQGIIRRVWCG